MTHRSYATSVARVYPHHVAIARAPERDPARTLITGTVCGVRVESVKEETMLPATSS